MKKNISVSYANKCFKSGEYAEALSIYEQLSNTNSLWKKILTQNIDICKNKLKNQSIQCVDMEISKSICDIQIKSQFEGFGIVRHNPLISVIIVSYNSAYDLDLLLKSLKSQTYKNFELIVLENGLEETNKICDKYFDDYKYLKENNIGFAAANNRCYEISSGEFVALINPDTKLENNFLQELLDAIRFDEHAAVVAPKINFYEKFISILIESNDEFSIDISALLLELSYKKYFIRSGDERNGKIISDKDNKIKIDIAHPAEFKTIPVEVFFGINLKSLKITIGYKSEWITFNNNTTGCLNIRFDAESYGSARYIINNAGSGLKNNNQPYDRGFGEYDDGQYFSKVYLSAFCGCAALIRKLAIINRKIFIDEFFAYYEDSELSWWIQSNNYKILYCPSAIVYHKHSESTQENSPTWKTLVSRSYKIYAMLTSKEDNISGKNFQNEYKNLNNSFLENKLKKFDELIFKSNSYVDLTSRPKSTVCIYNSYFTTMGGGEKHSLDIASLLQNEYEVYLASESDFSIINLQNYFGVDISKCKKLITTKIDSWFTSKFDIFINSTYRSNLESFAKKSYYIVSFPHKDIDFKILNKYKFLHNSPYTSRWANLYWGKHNSEIVLPIIGYYGKENVRINNKKKIILSVGRINSEGHCKNHHLIIQAYKKAIDSKQLDASWSLIIAGSCNFSSSSSLNYYNLLNNIKDGYNVNIEINLERKALEKLYNDAFMYVHATGLGVPAEQPERHEHFGITPHEAMRYGCYPIFYEVGGPAEQIKDLDLGSVFFSLDNLCEMLVQNSKLHDDCKSISNKVIAFTIEKEKNNFEKAKNEFRIASVL